MGRGLSNVPVVPYRTAGSKALHGAREAAKYPLTIYRYASLFGLEIPGAQQSGFASMFLYAFNIDKDKGRAMTF